MNRRETGDLGEEAACRYLKKKGYRIVCRNYRKPYGELDIVAETKVCCVFVEVRTRRSTAYGLPCETVSRSKQERLGRAAYAYVLAHRVEKMLRFDIIEVIADSGAVQSVNHIENAFIPPHHW